MMRGLSDCCRQCTERYPACHDHCEKYLDARKEWETHKRRSREMYDEYDEYKAEAISKMKRRRRKQYGK